MGATRAGGWARTLQRSGQRLPARRFTHPFQERTMNNIIYIVGVIVVVIALLSFFGFR